MGFKVIDQKEFMENYPDKIHFINNLRNPNLSWKFGFDKRGIPGVIDYELGFYYNPVTISQYAIGNIQCFFRTGNDAYKRRFVSCAKWLVENAVRLNDESYGWAYYLALEGHIRMPWFSAMAQGEAISVLCCAYNLEKNESYLNMARKAFEVLKTPIEDGGVLFTDESGYWLEEYPQRPPSHVLNGHLYTLFGVYSYLSVDKNDDATNFFNSCLISSAKRLHLYDNGYWTIYDLKEKLPVTLNYHMLHVKQLYFLSMLTNISYFEEMARKWYFYEKRPYCLYRSQLRRLFLMGVKSLESRKLYIHKRTRALRALGPGFWRS